MEIPNAGYEAGTSEHLPPLLGNFLEEVGEVKLEIQRIRSRVAVVKAFYKHINSTKTTEVRRDLAEKVKMESEVIGSALSKANSIINRWTSSQARVHKDGVSALLKDVLHEYEQVLIQHREESLMILKDMLKVTTVYTMEQDELEKGGGGLIVNQTQLKEMDNQKHIEIEERYCDLLKADRTLRSLKTKFQPLLSNSTYTDLAVLQLSQVVEQTRSSSSQSTTTAYGRQIILLGAIGSICLCGLFVLLLL